MSTGSTPPTSLGTQEAEIITASAKMTEALGTYIKDVSQAQAISVAAEGDQVIVEMQKVDLKMLRAEFHRLTVAQHNAAAEIERIKWNERLLNNVFLWERIPATRVNAWQQGWLYFLMRAGKIGHEAVAAVPCPSRARGADGFYHPTFINDGPAIDRTGTTKSAEQQEREEHRTPESQAALDRVESRMRERDRRRESFVLTDAPSHVVNAMGLVGWLFVTKVIPIAGSQAAEVITKAVDALGEVAAARLAKIQADTEAMRARTFKSFDPLNIAELKHNQALEGGAAK